MTKDDPVVQGAINTATSMLKDTDELLPTFFVVGADDKMNIVGAPFGPSVRDKDAAAMFVKRLCQKENAKAVLFISEAWTLGTQDPEVIKDFMNNRDKWPEVRLHPSAVEIVMFSLETKTEQWMGRAPILPERKRGEISWIECSSAEGRFTQFLGPKPERKDSDESENIRH